MSENQRSLSFHTSAKCKQVRPAMDRGYYVLDTGQSGSREKLCLSKLLNYCQVFEMT
jgi:hypothetical protein